MKNNIKRAWFARKAKSKYEKSVLKSTYGGDSDVPKEKHFQIILQTLKGSNPKISPEKATSILLKRLSDKNWSAVLKTELIIHRCIDHLSSSYTSDILETTIPVHNFEDNSQRGSLHTSVIQTYFAYILAYASNVSRKHSALSAKGSQRLKFAKSFTDANLLIEAEYLVKQLNFLVSLGPKCKIAISKNHSSLLESVVYWVLHDANILYTTTAMVLKLLEQRFFGYSQGDAQTIYELCKTFQGTGKALRDFFDLARWYMMSGISIPVCAHRSKRVLISMKEYVHNGPDSAVIRIKADRNAYVMRNQSYAYDLNATENHKEESEDEVRFDEIIGIKIRARDIDTLRGNPRGDESNERNSELQQDLLNHKVLGIRSEDHDGSLHSEH